MSSAAETPPENARVVIGLGELLWDEFADGRRPGGAPANVAYQSTTLGLRGMIASRVGRDEDGDLLVEAVRKKGVDISLVQVDGEHATGRVSIDLEDGEPSYAIHPAAWDHLEATPTLLEQAAGAAAICFGTLAQRGDESRDAIGSVLAVAGPLKVYDINLRQSFYSKDVIADSLAVANVAKLNQDEAKLLRKMLDLPDGEQFGAELRRRFELDLVCLTHGADGCELFGQQHVVAKAEPVKVADAVGAGDAFTAALTYSTLHDWPLQNRAELANAIGGLVASSRGAMPAIADKARAIRDRLAP